MDYLQFVATSLVVVLQKMEIPPLTYCLLNLSFKVKVRVTLRVAGYRQSVRLGTRHHETHDQRNFFPN
jgi:hypothetical protein